MRFQTPLLPARLIRRYKRFLADAELPDGQQVTAHCPNPGAMTGLAEPGTHIWLEPNDDPKKKLKYGWRLTELEDGALACIDTSVANKAVGTALRAGLLGPYDVQPEVRFGENSRVDFLLSAEQKLWVEVKSVTLMRSPGLAEFPDTVTKRGARHMQELAERVRAGDRAMLLYLVQRNDCTRVSVARDIDPGYAESLDAARAAGVEICAFGAELTTQGCTVMPAPLPVDLET